MAIISRGALDPMISSRMAADKKSQDDRILLAMREKGEDQRASMAQAGATQRQVMRQAAASAEARKSYESLGQSQIAERKHKMVLAESRQEFDAAQQTERLEQEEALSTRDYDRAIRSDEAEADSRDLQSMLTASNTAAMVAQLGKMGKIMLGEENNKQKLYNQYDEIHSKYTKDRKLYTTVVENVVRNVGLDDSILQDVGVTVGGTGKTREGAINQTLHPFTERNVAKIGFSGSPSAVVNNSLTKAFTNNQIPAAFSPSLLDKGEIKRFEEVLAGNRFAIPEVTKILGILDGTMQALTIARSDLKKSDPQSGRQLGDLTARYFKVKAYNDNLRDLAKSTRSTSDGRTIGEVIKTAIGIADGTSPGSFIDYQLKSGHSYETMQKQLESSQDIIPGIIPITDDLRPSLREKAERHNTRVRAAFDRASTMSTDPNEYMTEEDMKLIQQIKKDRGY